MKGGAPRSRKSAGFRAHEVTGESLLAQKGRVLMDLTAFQDVLCISGHEQLKPNKGAFPYAICPEAAIVVINRP